MALLPYGDEPYVGGLVAAGIAAAPGRIRGMLHVRVITPAGRTDEVVGLADESTAVTNLVVLPGAARSPVGDLVQFDMAREATDAMLDRLRELDIESDGAIVLDEIDVSLSDGARAAEAAAPGYDDDAVVWDELDARTAADARLSWAYVAFLALATQLAAIGALLDQPILIVGAMVLGPEFGSVAAVCFGLVRRDPARIVLGIRSLISGFVVAIAITTGCAAVSRWWGWIHPTMLDHRTLTEFIVHPDKWSFIVAVLAGIAGILSITAGKSSTLIGVFISVTTVPAAGNIAVAIPLAHWGEVAGSALQLGVNIGGMLLAGVATLGVQRILWARYGLRMPARRGAPGHGAAIRRSPRR